MPICLWDFPLPRAIIKLAATATSTILHATTKVRKVLHCPCPHAVKFANDSQTVGLRVVPRSLRANSRFLLASNSSVPPRPQGRHGTGRTLIMLSIGMRSPLWLRPQYSKRRLFIRHIHYLPSLRVNTRQHRKSHKPHPPTLDDRSASKAPRHSHHSIGRDFQHPALPAPTIPHGCQLKTPALAFRSASRDRDRAVRRHAVSPAGFSSAPAA